MFLLVFTNQMNGQHGPIYSQYMINKFLVNPAFAGSSGYTSANIVSRTQYTGFVNAPRSFAVTAQTRLLDDSYIIKKLQVRKKSKKATRDQKVGLGANIYNDRNGIISKTGIEFTYAYHLNIENDYQVSLGLTGSGFQYKLDDTDAYIYNPDDPLLTSNQKSFWVPDATFGVYFTNNKVYGGLSMNDLFGSALKLGSSHIKDNYRTVRSFNAIGGYRIGFENGLGLETSALLRAAKLSTYFETSVRLLYMNDYWLGFSYRTDKTLVTMAGVSFEMFSLAYAYDASFKNVSNYSSGSHELMFGIRFGDNSTRRFRWVKQDQINYE